MWRCVNDIFGYCAGEPTWAVKPDPLMIKGEYGSVDTGGMTGGKCQEDPKTCLYYRLSRQIISELKTATKRKRTKSPV